MNSDQSLFIFVVVNDFCFSSFTQSVITKLMRMTKNSHPCRNWILFVWLQQTKNNNNKRLLLTVNHTTWVFNKGETHPSSFWRLIQQSLNCFYIDLQKSDSISQCKYIISVDSCSPLSFSHDNYLLLSFFYFR